MPLVVPGLMSKDGGSSGDDWMSKLMGKKLGEQHNETVRGVLVPLPFARFPVTTHYSVTILPLALHTLGTQSYRQTLPP